MYMPNNMTFGIEAYKDRTACSIMEWPISGTTPAMETRRTSRDPTHEELPISLASSSCGEQS
jgi:hypothetical protein